MTSQIPDFRGPQGLWTKNPEAEKRARTSPPLRRRRASARASSMRNRPRIVRTLKAADEALRRIGIDRPRIAVSGVNPQAGEGGLFGSEPPCCTGRGVTTTLTSGLVLG